MQKQEKKQCLREAFEEVCKAYGIEPVVNQETYNKLLDAAEGFTSANFCQYVQSRFYRTKALKEHLKNPKFSESTLTKLATMNQNPGDMSDKAKQSIYKNLKDTLFLTNLVKHSADACLVTKSEDTSNNFVVSNVPDPYSDSTLIDKEAGALLQEAIEDKNDYDKALPFYHKILDAIAYAAECKITRAQARTIVNWRHCQYGGFKVSKNGLQRLAESVALAYNNITKKGVKWEQHAAVNPTGNLDGLNVWLSQHGLKLVELDNYENAEFNYSKMCEQTGLGENWKKSWGEDK